MLAVLHWGRAALAALSALSDCMQALSVTAVAAVCGQGCGRRVAGGAVADGVGADSRPVSMCRPLGWKKTWPGLCAVVALQISIDVDFTKHTRHKSGGKQILCCVNNQCAVETRKPAGARKAFRVCLHLLCGDYFSSKKGRHLFAACQFLAPPNFAMCMTTAPSVHRPPAHASHPLSARLVDMVWV